jgi:hypothetical protein
MRWLPQRVSQFKLVGRRVHAKYKSAGNAPVNPPKSFARRIYSDGRRIGRRLSAPDRQTGAHAVQDYESDENVRQRPLLPDHVTLSDIAASIHPDRQVCTATARNMMDRLGVRFIKVGNERLYSRSEVVRALLEPPNGLDPV